MFGFRATVNFEGTPKDNKENNESPHIIGGTYRAYREEFYGNGSLPEPPKKITPSMIKLPGVKETSAASKLPPLNAQSVPNITQASSSTNLTKDEKSKSTVNIAQQPQHANKVKVSPKDAKNQEKELKKLEKQRQAEQKKQLAEQKKREAEQKKLEKKQKADAAKEAKQQAAREAKLKKEREKALKEQNKNIGKKPKPSNAPPPPKMPDASKAPGVPEVRVTNPLARTNPLAQGSTNTIDSSISRSSGPPPYSDKVDVVPNKNDNSGNTSFSKPAEEENNWDFISQHRQQMSRPVTVNPMPRKKGGNLEYSVGSAPKLVDGGKSEA